MSDTARLEQDIQATRARLEGTINELAYRAQPQVIAQRQAQGLRLKLDAATHTPDGELRIERIAAMVAAAVAVVVVIGFRRLLVAGCWALGAGAGQSAAPPSSRMSPGPGHAGLVGSGHFFGSFLLSIAYLS